MVLALGVLVLNPAHFPFFVAVAQELALRPRGFSKNANANTNANAHVNTHIAGSSPCGSFGGASGGSSGGSGGSLASSPVSSIRRSGWGLSSPRSVVANSGSSISGGGRGGLRSSGGSRGMALQNVSGAVDIGGAVGATAAGQRGKEGMKRERGARAVLGGAGVHNADGRGGGAGVEGWGYTASPSAAAAATAAAMPGVVGLGGSGAGSSTESPSPASYNSSSSELRQQQQQQHQNSNQPQQSQLPSPTKALLQTMGGTAHGYIALWRTLERVRDVDPFPAVAEAAATVIAVVMGPAEALLRPCTAAAADARGNHAGGGVDILIGGRSHIVSGDGLIGEGAGDYVVIGGEFHQRQMVDGVGNSSRR